MRDYELIEELGQGAYSAVYRARRISDNRIVALKQLKLPPGLDAHQESTLLERFRSEAETARKLHHPGIVSIVDANEDEGGWYIAFDYIEGQTIQERLVGSGRFPAKQVAGIGRQLSEALAYAHDNGIIHRDIKPANIIIKSDGRALITDFGVATFLGSETRSPEEGAAFVGTPQYSSPEQVTASHVDARTDIFSLGAVLYEMAAGRPAFGGESLGEIIHRITAVQAEPLRRINPSFPPSLENVIFKCLAKDAAFRYQTANDLTLALMEAMPEAGTAAGATMPSRPPASDEAVVIFMSGPQEGQEIKLHPSITTIGRKMGDVTIPDDDTLENQHAWVTKEDGGYFLYDAGTKGGTFVAGRRIDRIGLNHGDEITLGRQKLIYSGPSVSDASEPKPLTPADILPKRKPVLARPLLLWLIAAVIVIAMVAGFAYMFAIAPSRLQSRVGRQLAAMYEPWQLSFVEPEITTVEALKESAVAIEQPSFERLEEQLEGWGATFVPSVNLMQQDLVDRLAFIKGLYAVIRIFGEYTGNPGQTVMQLTAAGNEIKQLQTVEQDDQWRDRMLASTTAIEKFKALFGATQQAQPSARTSREAAATALYKAYRAYMNTGMYSFDRVMNYFRDAEDELINLGGNPAESEFADYNLAVCYFFMGSHLMGNAGYEGDAAEFFYAASDLVVNFIGKSHITEQYMVAGLERDLYNPHVLKARIDLALDSLEDRGFAGE